MLPCRIERATTNLAHYMPPARGWPGRLPHKALSSSTTSDQSMAHLACRRTCAPGSTHNTPPQLHPANRTHNCLPKINFNLAQLMNAKEGTRGPHCQHWYHHSAVAQPRWGHMPHNQLCFVVRGDFTASHRRCDTSTAAPSYTSTAASESCIPAQPRLCRPNEAVPPFWNAVVAVHMHSKKQATTVMTCTAWRSSTEADPAPFKAAAAPNHRKVGTLPMSGPDRSP